MTNEKTYDELELNSLAYLEQLGYTCIPEGKMLKETMEGIVKEYCYLPELNYASTKVVFDSIPTLEFKVGDKVRIIKEN